jgi:hypothetical protein
MSDFTSPQSDREDLHTSELSPETHAALAQCAERSGRTIHEEAEHIIKTHLAGASTAADA